MGVWLHENGHRNQCFGSSKARAAAKPRAPVCCYCCCCSCCYICSLLLCGVVVWWWWLILTLHTRSSPARSTTWYSNRQEAIVVTKNKGTRGKGTAPSGGGGWGGGVTNERGVSTFREPTNKPAASACGSPPPRCTTVGSSPGARAGRSSADTRAPHRPCGSPRCRRR